MLVPERRSGITPNRAGASCLHAHGVYSVRNLNSNGAAFKVSPSPAENPHVIADSRSSPGSTSSRCEAHEVKRPLACRVLSKPDGTRHHTGDLVCWVYSKFNTPPSPCSAVPLGRTNGSGAAFFRGDAVHRLVTMLQLLNRCLRLYPGERC